MPLERNMVISNALAWLRQENLTEMEEMVARVK